MIACNRISLYKHQTKLLVVFYIAEGVSPRFMQLTPCWEHFSSNKIPPAKGASQSKIVMLGNRWAILERGC